jgi:hypothetical protein
VGVKEPAYQLWGAEHNQSLITASLLRSTGFIADTHHKLFYAADSCMV